MRAGCGMKDGKSFHLSNCAPALAPEPVFMRISVRNECDTNTYALTYHVSYRSILEHTHIHTRTHIHTHTHTLTHRHGRGRRRPRCGQEQAKRPRHVEPAPDKRQQSVTKKAEETPQRCRSILKNPCWRYAFLKLGYNSRNC